MADLWYHLGHLTLQCVSFLHFKDIYHVTSPKPSWRGAESGQVSRVCWFLKIAPAFMFCNMYTQDHTERISLSPATLQWSYLVTCLLHWSTRCGNLTSENYCLFWLIWLEGTSESPRPLSHIADGETESQHVYTPCSRNHIAIYWQNQPYNLSFSYFPPAPTLLWLHHLVWNSSSLTHTGCQGQW